MTDHKKNTLHSQEEALESYFDDLLVTSNKSKPGVDASKNLKLVHSVLSTEQKAGLNKEPKKIDKAAANVKPTKKETGLMHKGQQNAVEKQVVAATLNSKRDAKPLWANDIFEVVVFVIKQMKFAIPTFAVKECISLPLELNNMPNQPEWVMGLNVYSGGFSAIVDSGLLLLNQTPRDLSTSPYSKVLLLAESRWGLAVDEVLETVQLSSQDVKWRGEVTARRWLAGLASQQQLAVIEPDYIFTKNQ